MVIIETDHTNVIETLELGSIEIFEKPSGEFRAEKMEIFTAFGGEMAKAAFMAGKDIDRILGFVEGLEEAGGG